MLATTNTTMMLKRTSVSPGAVMKNGRCVVAAGFGETVTSDLLSDGGANPGFYPINPHAVASSFDLDQACHVAPRRGLLRDMTGRARVFRGLI
jgi:hypothetical protein